MDFTITSSYPIGLDISDLSVKLVQLAKHGDKIKIRAAGKISLPPGWLVNGEVKEKEALAKAIKKLVSRPDFGLADSREAITCLPEGKTFLKIIEAEKNAYSLEETIRAEIEKHIPLPAEDIYYDWQIIGDTGRSQLVLVGAAPRKIVDEQVSLLSEAGLSVVAMETEPISICRALLAEEGQEGQNAPSKNYAIIDIGATDASLTVYSKNTILFSLSMPVSGQDITEKIAEALEINPEQAEKMKIAYGLNEESHYPQIKKILAETTGELAKKTREAITFFNHHFSNWGPIEKVVICGGGANIKGLDKIIADEIEIETVLGDALTNLGKREGRLSRPFQRSYGLAASLLRPENDEKKKKRGEKILKITQDESLSYATAIGLALRGIFLDE